MPVVTTVKAGRAPAAKVGGVRMRSPVKKQTPTNQSTGHDSPLSVGTVDPKAGLADFENRLAQMEHAARKEISLQRRWMIQAGYLPNFGGKQRMDKTVDPGRSKKRQPESATMARGLGFFVQQPRRMN
ncbi:hypothetical protein HK102_000736 [Quaeritorhiza haematococci]|nr:hypothetical protein HK102_000736 [Quaeritorhiza haematococci]